MLRVVGLSACWSSHPSCSLPCRVFHSTPALAGVPRSGCHSVLRAIKQCPCHTTLPACPLACRKTPTQHARKQALSMPSFHAIRPCLLAPLLAADSNSPARQQLYDLCHGMRLVRLSADTPAQVGWVVAPWCLGVAGWGAPSLACTGTPCISAVPAALHCTQSIASFILCKQPRERMQCLCCCMPCLSAHLLVTTFLTHCSWRQAWSF